VLLLIVLILRSLSNGKKAENMKSVKIRPGDIYKNHFEQQAWQNNSFTAGIDEVGRGCLAGPVVTAAAIVPQRSRYPFLKDSKLLKQEERERAYRWLSQKAWFAWSLVNPYLIDQFNIYYATLYAMRRALSQLLVQLPTSPHTVLTDAMPLTYNGNFTQMYHLSDGEQKSVSIAAASIVAKVNRDRIMRQTGTIFPVYHFTSNKGYSTKVHKAQLTTFGPSFIHRANFLTWLPSNKTSQILPEDGAEE